MIIIYKYFYKALISALSANSAVDYYSFSLYHFDAKLVKLKTFYLCG